MILLYAYIQKFKNYINQEVVFDTSYQISFSDGLLSITYRGADAAKEMLRGNRKPDNLHLLVGKTGSGKTNLLQLIGMKHDTRTHRKWEGEGDSYFFLYKINDHEFFIEICDVDIRQFPGKAQSDISIPQRIRENATRMSTIRTVRFQVKSPLSVEVSCKEFIPVPEYGWSVSAPREKVRDMGIVINSYDIHAFMKPPYPDERESCQDMGNDWLGRLVLPYHRTALWQICDYIREYLSEVEPGDTKRQTSFVLSTQNFADRYPIQLPRSIENEYWTFKGIKQDEERADYDAEARKRLSRRKKRQNLSDKQMFIHDLWTDYAIYLRKWIERIHSYREEIPEENQDWSGMGDVFQEFNDYYAEKEYSESFDSAELPDGQRMSIVKRCTWLAEYIDRADNGNPHGLLWQIIDDIKDIGKILEKLDDKFFTMDTFSIPVVDMACGKNKEWFETMFERMEQYRPDDAGIFTTELLPYGFTHLSTGEYQYAKVLGGMEEYMKMSFSGGKRMKRDKIVLLDEPEAYMHPELARQFIAKLYEITERYTDASTLQVIIGTHSPFMMSDVLPDEITRLDIDSDTGNAIVRNGSDKEYFGANIHAILADSFFLTSTIGEYSRRYLQNAYDRLVHYYRSGTSDQESQDYVRTMQKLLPHIGDQLICRAFELIIEQLEEQAGSAKLEHR